MNPIFMVDKISNVCLITLIIDSGMSCIWMISDLLPFMSPIMYLTKVKYITYEDAKHSESFSNESNLFNDDDFILVIQWQAISPR